MNNVQVNSGGPEPGALDRSATLPSVVWSAASGTEILMMGSLVGGDVRVEVSTSMADGYGESENRTELNAQKVKAGSENLNALVEFQTVM